MIFEGECVAVVQLSDGNDMGFVKLNQENITTSLNPSRGKLVRGDLYRVTIEKIERITP
jgi:hypothetical protein